MVIPNVPRKCVEAIKEIGKKKFIFLLPYFLWLFVDSFNGMLIRVFNFPLSLSQFFKGAVILASVAIIKDKRHLLIILGLILYSIVLTTIHIYNPVLPGLSTPGTIKDNLIVIIKLFTPIFLVFILLAISKKTRPKAFENVLSCIFIVNLIVIVLNIFAPAFGLGEYQYASEIGSKGFFASGNELAGTFAVIAAFILYKIRNTSNRNIIFISFILIFFGVLLGSKVAVLGSVLFSLMTIFFLRHDKLSGGVKTEKAQKQHRLSVALLGSVLVASAVLISQTPQFTEFLGRQEYMLNLQKSVISGLLSGRDELIETAIDFIQKDFKKIHFLFGIGYGNIDNALFKYFPHHEGITENDFVDLFMFTGVFAIFYYVVWALYIVRLFRHRKKSSWIAFSFVLNFSLLLISVTSGHTIYSATIAPFWAIPNAMAIKRLPQLNIIERIKNIQIRKIMRSMWRWLWLEKRLVFIPIFFTLGIDMMNGFIKETIDFSLSFAQFYKGIAITVMVFFLTKAQRIKVMILGLLVLSLVLYHSTNNLAGHWGWKTESYMNLVFYVKLIAPLVIYFVFTNLKNKLGKHKFKKFIHMFFVVSLAFLFVNELFAVQMILSGNSYDTSAKGFFLSWNELSITYVVVISYFLYKLRNSSNIKVLLASVFFQILTILVYKRVSIFGTLLTILFTFYFLRHDAVLCIKSAYKKLNIRYFRWLFVTSIATAGLILGIQILTNTNSKTFQNKWASNIERIQNTVATFGEGSEEKGLSLIFSGRNRFTQKAFNYIREEFTIQDYLFGIGYSNTHIAVGDQLNGEPKITEIDAVDIFMSVGFLGVVYYGIWIGYIVWLLKNIKNGIIYAYIGFVNIVMLASSLTAGHVIYSAMNAPFWAAINALGYNQKIDRKRKIGLFTETTEGGIAVWTRIVSDYLKNSAEKVKVIGSYYKRHHPFINSAYMFKALTQSVFFAISNAHHNLVFHINCSEGNSFIRTYISIKILSFFSNVKFVIQIHGGMIFPYLDDLLNKKIGRWIFKDLFSTQSLAIVLSLPEGRKEKLNKYFSKYLDAVQFEHRVLTNPIDFDSISGGKKKKPKGKVQLLSVSRLVDEKNNFYLLQAAKSLIDRGFTDFKLTIVGEGPERPNLEEYVKQHLLGEYVDLPGWADRKSLKKYYLGSDIFVLGSKYESFGLVVLEAYSNHLPVIATKVGGLPELITDGVNGYLVDVQKPEEMAKKIIKLAKNSDMISKIGKNNYKKAKKYDIRKVGKKLLEIYDSVFEIPDNNEETNQ